MTRTQGRLCQPWKDYKSYVCLWLEIGMCKRDRKRWCILVTYSARRLRIKSWNPRLPPWKWSIFFGIAGFAAIPPIYTLPHSLPLTVMTHATVLILCGAKSPLFEIPFFKIKIWKQFRAPLPCFLLSQLHHAGRNLSVKSGFESCQLGTALHTIRRTCYSCWCL